MFTMQQNIITLMLAVFGVPLLFWLISKLRFRSAPKVSNDAAYRETVNQRIVNLWDELDALKMQWADSLVKTQEIPRATIRKVRKSVKKGRK